MPFGDFLPLLAAYGSGLAPTGPVIQTGADESRLETPEQLAMLRQLAIEPSVLRAVKPFTWQLRDVTNIPHLKWHKQPSMENMLSLSPWNLKDGDLLLFKDDREHEIVVIPEEDEGAKLAVATATAAETGFRIYSAEEQTQRRELKAKEQEERLKLLEEKMSAVAAALATKANGGQ